MSGYGGNVVPISRVLVKADVVAAAIGYKPGTVLLLAPLEVQQALMRHAHISTTLEYGKYSPKRAERLRDANDKVVKLVAG